MKNEGLSTMFRIALYPDNPMSISLLVIIIIIVLIFGYTIAVWSKLEPVRIGRNRPINIQRYEQSNLVNNYDETDMRNLIGEALVGSISPEVLKVAETRTGQNAYQVFIWMEELWKDCKLIAKKKKSYVNVDEDTIRFVVNYGELFLKRDGSVVIKASYGSAGFKKIDFDKFVANPMNFDRIAVKLRLI